MMYFDLNLLSKYRSYLMGVATIFIILCHAPASKVLLPDILVKLFTYGNWGVEIFLFLSGIGCYYSLSKGGSITSYYKRRFVRIFVPYFLIYTVICIIEVLIGKYSFLDGFLNLSTIGYWLYHRAAWFVALLIPLYLISPVLYNISKCEYGNVLLVLLIIAVIYFCNLSFTEKESNSIIGNIQWAFIRSIHFIIGFIIAKFCQSKTRISIFILFGFIFILFVLLQIVGIQNRWCIVYPFLVFLSISFEIIDNQNFLLSSLNILGKISLESYLTNIGINGILMYLIPTYISSSLFYGRYLEYSFVIVVGLIWAFYANRLSKRIIEKI